MIHEDRDHHEPKRAQFPLDPSSYEILDEIGIGMRAIVYKAVCIPMNSAIVAIKSIDMDRSPDFEDIRREAKTLSLLSHPNILNSLCSFTVDRRLWVVMPFMSGGSLQSIITSSFPNGFSEPCIAIVLKEILQALVYLHDQGHLHRDIKAGNILLDSNGSVKLADFGVSTSIFEPNSKHGCSYSSSSAALMLTDFTGTPYWMAPEMIHSHNGYSFKADIWSFGITALELAHGRPPLSHLPLSKSLLLRITKRFRFSDYEKNKDEKNKKFSKAFKDMVALCLNQDPAKRPSAEKLMKHSFFKYCKGPDFLVKNVMQNLPSVEERFRVSKLTRTPSIKSNEEEEEEEVIIKHRRISGWNFNEDGLKLDPVFPTIMEDVFKGTSDSGGSGGSNMSSPGGVREKMLPRVVSDHEVVGGWGNGVVVERESMVGGLIVLKKSLEEQRRKVVNLIGLLGVGEEGAGEVSTGEHEQMISMNQLIERLKVELEIERKKNFESEMELEFLKLQSGL